jgi:hypothetical protein
LSLKRKKTAKNRQHNILQNPASAMAKAILSGPMDAGQSGAFDP